MIPDQGIWHPMAPRVFENVNEYKDWLYNTHAPAVGIDPETAAHHTGTYLLEGFLLHSSSLRDQGVSEAPI